MTTPGTPHHDSDDDPTGIRALLSSLPDPGPMPEELVQRISASLREEQRRRESRYEELVAGPPPAADGPQRGDASQQAAAVVSLDRERQRRRPTRALSVLGAAAALAVAATVVTSQVFGGSAGDIGVSAQYGADSGAGGEVQTRNEVPRENQDGAGAAQDGGGDPAEAPGLVGAAPEVVVVPGTFAATRDGFAEAVRRELPAWEQGSGAAGEEDSATDDGAAATEDVLDAEEAASCARSAPEVLPARAKVVVTAATLDGVASVVLVQTRPGPVTAWVLPASCARGPAELLHGPVVLD